MSKNVKEQNRVPIKHFKGNFDLIGMRFLKTREPLEKGKLDSLLKAHSLNKSGEQ